MKPDPLSPEDQAIVEEELALLESARAAIDRAAARPTHRAPSAADLRELRDEAVAARDQDLAPLLQELAVRKALHRRAAEQVFPDREQPYFAHLKVREGKEQRDYLLGDASLFDGGVRLVDWRVAPVAQIFYRYREGDAYEEEFPGRTAEGTVVARRIVVLQEGALVEILTDDRALRRERDGRWRREGEGPGGLRPGGSGTAFRPGDLVPGSGSVGRKTPITALLDREQFAAIQAPPERPLLVLGSAGSGKTTVALHRLALVAAKPNFPIARSMVVVPEEGLARLTRRLLAPLGARDVQVKTLDEWILWLARLSLGDTLPRVWTEAPSLTVSLKRHPALFDELRRRFQGLTPEKATLPRLRRALTEAFTDRALLGRVVSAAGAALPLGAIEDTVRHTLRQSDDSFARELRSITDRERTRTLDSKGIDEDTPDDVAGTVDLEDLPILLSLRASVGLHAAPTLAHLVLDEAEDFSLFELDLLRRHVGPRTALTLAGDEAQQTTSSFGGWRRNLEILGAQQPLTCRLSTSYRCPRPIAEIAARVLGPLAPPTPLRAARDGVPVASRTFHSPQTAHLFLASALADLLNQDPTASVGVLCRDLATAQNLHRVLAPQIQARLVERGEFSFDPGVDVAEVASAKGLEFDYVVVPDASADQYPADDDARRTLHVAVTRASHQLLLLSVDTPSPLLAP